VVSDLFEGQAVSHQASRAGMTQRMRAAVGDLNAKRHELPSDNAVDPTVR
jgi:hypothetical protein